MKSPFAIFRKHEKIMMVILVGLSMIGFVLLGAFNDPSDQVPPVLIFLCAMAVFGMAAWIAGMPSGRSKEYGGWGLVLGAAVSFLFITMSRPSAAVHADFGNLSREDLRNLQTRRELANKFVFEAIRATADPKDPRTEELLGRSQFRFSGNATSPRDVVLGEILRREAERLGLEANDDSVTQYVQKITSNRITTEQFNKIRGELHLSENQLYDILREQLQAKVAAEMLYAPAWTMPPEKYWEFYRQLYVKQTADVAGIPVKDFVDASATPPPAELNRIFSEYRENYPNQTKEGRLEEGRPGLYQPRRAKLAFLEATFEDAEAGVAAVTDEEIRAYYEEHYVRTAEEAARRRSAAGAAGPTPPAESNAGPALPGPSQPGPESTPTDPAKPSSADGDKPGDASEPPAGGSPPKEGTPAPAGSPESPAEGNPESAALPGPASTPPTTGDCAQEADPPATTSGNPAPPESGTPEKSTDAPAASTTDAPDATQPAEGSAGQPAAASPETPATTSATPTAAEPPLPQPAVPLLDEKLKETIRTALIDERVAAKLKEKLHTAADYVQDKIGRAFIAPEKNAEPMTIETAAKRAADYAAEQHLHYGDTPYLSAAELAEQSEDYPIGMATTTTPGREDFVARAVFTTGERDLYRPIIARSEATKSWFACWKVGEEAAYAPDNMNDDRVREQAITIWRQLEARKKAKVRADELAQQVRDSGKPMSEALGEQKITGSESSLFLTVINTGEFHYQGVPGTLDPNPFTFYFQQPQILSPSGVEKAGPAFMETVFNELSPGEVGVATNVDHSTFYVVKVLTRSQATPEELAAFRKRFLEEPLFEGYSFGAGRSFPSVYQHLAIGELQQNLLDWQGQLLRQHGVQLSDVEQ